MYIVNTDYKYYIVTIVLICHSFLRVPVPQDSITFPIFAQRRGLKDKMDTQ